MAKEIEIPENLRRKINAHTQNLNQQIMQLQAQARRDIELLVDGYVSSLELPADAALEYNHATGVLSYASAKEEEEPTGETISDNE